MEELATGDAVFGATNDCFVGAYAEFALARASRLARKPADLRFIEAGGIPVVAVTGWAMLFDYGGLHRAGPEVMGASSSRQARCMW